MTISTRFLKASASVATLAFAAGCATTGLPQYRSVDAGTRTANTEVTPTGVRVNPDSTPVRINYDACSALKKEIKAMTSGNATTRAINQGTGAVAAGARKGSKNIGEVIVGAAAGIGVSIAGDQAVRAINSPRIAALEADCNQQKVSERFTKDYSRWQKEFQSCVTKNSRGTKNVIPDPQAVAALCRDFVRPVANPE